MSKPTAKGFKSGFKSFAKGFGEVLDGMAEAAAENRRVEAEARMKVEEAIREYEIATGKSWYPSTSGSVLPNNMLPWDPDHKGHLINCRETCRDTHCLICGSYALSGPYCSSHRPH